jgi:hypothetical protein
MAVINITASIAHTNPIFTQSITTQVDKLGPEIDLIVQSTCPSSVTHLGTTYNRFDGIMHQTHIMLSSTIIVSFQLLRPLMVERLRIRSDYQRVKQVKK